MTEERHPANRAILRSYSVRGDLLTETDPRGNVTTHEYDALKRKLKTTRAAVDGQVATTEWRYDENSNLVESKDARGNATLFEFDFLNRKTKQTDPTSLGFVQTWTYDQNDNVLTTKDRRQIETAYTYDKENRPLSTTRDSQPQETRVLDENGNLTRLTDANGNTTVYKFDELNRQIEINAPLQATTTMSYSPAGDVLTMRDPESRLTQMAYDIRRRKVSETNGANEVTRFSYDLVNNLRARSNPKEIAAPTNLGSNCERSAGTISTIVFCYDAANRLTDVIDAEANRTRYAYDLASNRISTTDAKGNVSAMSYDARNRVRTMTAPALAAGQGAPLTSVKTMAYDGNDNVVSETTPNGAVIKHTFDVINRKTNSALTSAAQPNQWRSTQTTFDPNGNVTRIEDSFDSASSQVTVQGYDDLDRKITETDPWNLTTRFGYDLNGNQISLTDSQGELTAFQFDALNRNTSTSTPGRGTTAIGYDKSGLKLTDSFPDGSLSTTQYDAAKRISLIDHSRASASIARVSYRHDSNGNRIEQQETNGGAEQITTYQYDQADRLTRVEYPDKRVDYTLDQNSNRTSETERTLAGVATKTTTLTLNARDQITREEQRDGGNALIAETAFTYDANGNQLTRATTSQPPVTQAWDVKDRLVTLTTQGGPPSQHRYNHLDRRIGRETNGQALRYRYVDLSLIETLNVTNTPVERFYYSGESLIGQKKAGEQRSYLLDALKSPQAQITAAGIVRTRMSFDAFGNVRNTTGTNDQPFGFTGYQLDPESNRYYALARYYDQSHGKFLSQDPELGAINNPPSLHRYLYAYANPGRYVDPDGRVAAIVSGAALGFSLGVGQGVGSLLYDCAMWGDCQGPGALASLVAQNTIAGAEIGAAIDVSVLSGGLAAPVVGGALAGAGLSGLTVGGRAADWNQFASNQLAYAAGGAVAGAVIHSGGLGAGLASTAMGRIGGTAFASALGGAAGDVTTQSIEIATGYRGQLDQGRVLAAGLTGGVMGGATVGAMEYSAYRAAKMDAPKVEPLLNLSVEPVVLVESANSTGAIVQLGDNASAQVPIAFGTPFRQLSRKARTAMLEKLESRTLTRDEWSRLEWSERLTVRRQEGIDGFWSQERQRLAQGLPGTRNWSPDATQSILSGGTPRGIFGHHRYSVSLYPQLANDASNIAPVTFYEHFYNWHGGNWRNPTHGIPLRPDLPPHF